MSEDRAERPAWPDVARGGCMLLVVLLHTDHALGHGGEADAVLHQINRMLVPLRQPMFFLIAGVLGAGVLRRGAAGVLLHRVARYAWLFVLWWGLGRLFQSGLLGGAGPVGIEQAFFQSPETLGALLLSGQDDHWFFYALAVFFGLALLLGRLPAPVHAGLALLIAAPGLAELGVPLGMPALDCLWYYPVFALGAARPRWIWRAAGWLGRWPCLLLALAAWVGATRFALRIDPLLGNAVTAALALLAVPAGLAASVLLARLGGPLAGAVRQVGRMTLPIYVLHSLVLRLLLLGLERPPVVPKAVFVLAVAGLAVVFSLLLGRALGRVPGLFGLPPPLQRLARPSAPG